jgi:hypothetical protein
MRLAIQRNWQRKALGVLLVCLASALPLKADLVVSAESVTASPGSLNNTFEVDLVNTGASTIDVSAFALEINTPSSDITFEQATTATAMSYIFAGNSLFGPIINTDGPGQTLDFSDLASTPNSFTAVAPGTTFGLGLIFFDVAPGASSQVATVNFNTAPNISNASDQNGNNLPLDFVSGAITITSAPEPSSWMLLVTGLVGLVWARRRARRAE